MHSELEYYIRAETAKQIEEQAFEDDDAYDSAYESISAELRTTIQDGLSTDMIKCLIAWAQCKYDMGIRGLQSPWAPQDWAQAKYERLGKKQVELQTVIPMLVEGNEFQWLSLGCNSGSNEVLLLGNGKILMRISIWHRSFYITDNSHYYLIAQPTWMKPGHPNYKLHCLLKRLFGSSPDLYDVNDIPDTEDYLSAMDLDDIALQPDIKDDVSAVNPSDVDLQLGAGDGVSAGDLPDADQPAQGSAIPAGDLPDADQPAQGSAMPAGASSHPTWFSVLGDALYCCIRQ